MTRGELLTMAEREEGFELFAKLHREGKKLTSAETNRMEHLIDLAAEQDYLTLNCPDDSRKEEYIKAIKATYDRDLWG